MPYDQFGNFTPYQQPYQRQTQQQNVYAFVNGLDGAKNFSIPSNQSMLLMDSEQSVCYLKQANALGQTTLKCYKLVEVNENDLRQNTTNPVGTPVSLDKNEEFVQLKQRVSELEKKLGEKHE